MPANPYTVDMAAEPVTVTTDATGTISVSVPQIGAGRVSYDVTLTLPLTMDQIVFEEPDTASMSIRGSTVIKSSGRIVLVSDYGKAVVPASTGLEEAAPGATSFHRGPGDQELEWDAQLLQVTAFAAVADTFKDPANPRNLQQFHLNNASIIVTTERIDVRGASDVRASVDLRIWDTSTGFEADDGLTLKVLVSRDGILFEEQTWIDIRGTATVPLSKGQNGAFTTYTTEPGFIPDDAASIRIVLEANTNSNNEHLFWDNLRGGPPVPFRRGDCDVSGSTDIADALKTLFWLFTDTPTPTCLDSCDSSDDGKVDVTDAIYTLSWLFRRGAAPRAPGPDSCGLDSTPSSSASCEAYAACP